MKLPFNQFKVSLYHLNSLTRAFTDSTCNSRWRSQMRLTLKEQSECGMFCPGRQKWHGMLCPGWQKQHGMLCLGWQKQHGMFCPGWQILVGCFVRGVIKWHGMFCPGMFCLAPGIHIWNFNIIAYYFYKDKLKPTCSHFFEVRGIITQLNSGWNKVTGVWR